MSGRRTYIGQIGRLKGDMKEEYTRLHSAPWKGVTDMISACHIENYSIFLYGDIVFSYFEYTGDDFDADMAKMAADETTQKWWEHTHPCFMTYSVSEKDEYCADMKQVFYLK